MRLEFGRRFCLAVLIFIVGLHLIGWGILFSGTAGPGNPVWPMISAMFALEKLVLSVLLFAFVLGSTIAVLVQVVRAASSQALESSDYTAPRAIPAQNELPLQLKLPVSPSIFYDAPSAPLQTTQQKLRLSEPSQPPTAEALREQALKQIIGG